MISKDLIEASSAERGCFIRSVIRLVKAEKLSEFPVPSLDS